MRIQKIKALITIILFLLIVRLLYISYVVGDDLKKEAFKQQTTLLNNKAERKIIYDKDMRVLAGASPRYKNNNILNHVIGYIWDGGASGIEKAFNSVLIKEHPDLIAVQKSAEGSVVKKTQLKSDESFSGIRLTVDYHIQSVVEEVMEEEKLTGAVIVADPKSGGILAMASKPGFERDKISSYFNSNNGELLNRALCQYNVGSVFKIITAASALESKFSYEYSFYCTGKTDIDGTSFVCNKKEGHGQLTFTEGFAHSCNCLFYNLGLETGYEQIRKCAYDFGFGEQILKINGFDEAWGNIPAIMGTTKSDVANISIGQGQILATPLQVADMMCTIANDGIRTQLTLIDGIVDSKGVCTPIKPTRTGRIISSDTNRALKQMLKEAVQYGTGMPAAIDGVQVAGKTATAETGWLKSGEFLTHGWFAGYFPADNPEYVCVVLAENGNYGSVSAAPVFKKIGEKILDL